MNGTQTRMVHYATIEWVILPAIQKRLRIADEQKKIGHMIGFQLCAVG